MKKRLGDLTLDELANICRRHKSGCETCPLFSQRWAECVIVDNFCPIGWPVNEIIEV